MVERASYTFWVAGWAWASGCVALSSLGCSNPDQVLLSEEATSSGSAQLALTIGDPNLDTATAVLSRPDDGEFEPETRTIDVQRRRGVFSVFFDDLPVGSGYALGLRAGSCSGAAEFGIAPAATTLVAVTLVCPVAGASTGAQTIGTLGAVEATAATACTGGACNASAVALPVPITGVSPPSPPTACSDCTFEFCGAQLAAVNRQPDSVAPLLACVLGEGWQSARSADATRCANFDVLDCYCGSVASFDCGRSAPSAVDGLCRDEILAASACSDSTCVESTFLSPLHPSGNALQYVQCQQDFCYDLCFNP